MSRNLHSTGQVRPSHKSTGSRKAEAKAKLAAALARGDTAAAAAISRYLSALSLR